MKSYSHDKAGKVWNRIVITLFLIYLFMPVVATFLYSFSTAWVNTLLPEGLTLKWYKEMFTDTRFLEAIGRTLLVSGLTVVISLLIMIPTIFIIAVYLPKWERFMQIMVLMPFAFPGVVMAVGLIKMYSSGPIAIAGTIWILVGAYFVVILPFMYQGIRNSLRTIDAPTLMEAAEVLGASKIKAFRIVIVPNILPGVLIASLLSFAVLFGEFVLANMMVGGQFETIQIYVYKMIALSGHMTSATVTLLFILVFVLSGIVLKLGQWKPGSKASKDTAGEAG